MIRFYGEELLAPRPTPKLEDHPLSSVRHCLLNMLPATLHTGGRSSICNLRTRLAVVTGTHLPRPFHINTQNKPNLPKVCNRFVFTSNIEYVHCEVGTDYIQFRQTSVLILFWEGRTGNYAAGPAYGHLKTVFLVVPLHSSKL